MPRTCEFCDYYEIEDENGRNFCQWFGAYYYPYDTCRHWKERGSGSSGCFMTTACCEHKGLHDNCEELQTMRAMRDGYMKPRPDLNALVEEYYRVAPGIVSAINARDDADAIWDDVYERIRQTMVLVKAGKNEEAVKSYQRMVSHCQAMTAQ